MNTNTPKISVIIPIYNVEKYIARCLRSVLENTYQNLEVLCINDGSTDKSGEILQNIASQDNRVKVLNQPNQGVSVARNHGLDVATGDYVAFVDADDWVHQQYFECLLNACLKTGAPISMCQMITTYDKFVEDKPLKRPLELSQQLFVSECFTNWIFHKRYVWGKLFRRDIISVRFEKGISFGEDTIFVVNVLSKNPEICVNVLLSHLYYYYQHSGSRGSLVPSEAYLPIADAYLKCADLANLSQPLKNVILGETIKKLLEYRYEAWIESKQKAARHNFKTRYSKLKQFMKFLPLKDQIIYRILAAFPFLYRFIRIMKDKTLLEWEKVKPQLLAQYNAQK